jgi:tetratricopeptide (TPR) repeat protein
MRSTNLLSSLGWRTRRLIQQMRYLAQADPLSRKIYFPSMLRFWASRPMPGITDERYTVEYGTPPTPADPTPSNRTITRYPDGSCFTDTPPPTPTILAEYVQAIAAAPEDAGLRTHYSFALQRVNELAAASEQIREALRLAPDSAYAHRTFACLLQAQGEHAAAVEEFQLYLHLSLQKEEIRGFQGEVQLRWYLVTALQKAGRLQEAQTELDHALVLLRRLVSEKRGSPDFLARLEAEQSALVGA